MISQDGPAKIAVNIDASVLTENVADLTDQQKLAATVLLAEYTAMRNQVISRGASLIQVSSIGVASLGLISVKIESNPVLASGLFLFLLAVVGMLWRFIKRDIDREAAHVRTLETRINKVANDHTLLTWETLHGGVTVGYTTGFWDFLASSIRKATRKVFLLTWVGVSLAWIGGIVIGRYGYKYLAGQLSNFISANAASLEAFGPPLLLATAWILSAWLAGRLKDSAARKVFSHIPEEPEAIAGPSYQQKQ